MSLNTPLATSKFAGFSRSIQSIVVLFICLILQFFDIRPEDADVATIADGLMAAASIYALRRGYVGRKDAAGTIHILPRLPDASEINEPDNR